MTHNSNRLLMLPSSSGRAPVRFGFLVNVLPQSHQIMPSKKVIVFGVSKNENFCGYISS